MKYKISSILSLLAALVFAPLATSLLAASPDSAPAIATPARLNETDLPPNAVWVDSLDLTKIDTTDRPPMACQSEKATPLSIDGVVYPHGVGFSGTTLLRFNLKKSSRI